MATTQQAIDTKYDYYLALRDEKLKALFSPVILGWARENGLKTFEAMVNYNNVLGLPSRELKTLKGLDLLAGLTQLNIGRNQLTDVGDLSGLFALQYLYANVNELTNVGRLYDMINLISLRLNENQFATEQVDQILSDMHTAYDATGKISSILLNGANMGVPTGGVNNADYVYLTNAGVSVTIQTA